MTVTQGPWLVTGAWQPGRDPGRRQFVDVGPVNLEAGGFLPEVRIAFETWGRLNDAGDNAVLVEHALTGDSHVAGPAGAGHPTPGWWDSMVGPGRAIDTDRYFVVVTNVLGGCQGSTGPSSPAPGGQAWGSRFPFLTIRDQVAVEAEVARRLGIAAWALVVGGSMGGMRTLEWAVGYPEQVRRAVVIAATAATSADQIAWAQPQLLAIRHDAHFFGGDYYDREAGPSAGLGIARRIAHITYRSAEELDSRFWRQAQGGEQPLSGGRYAVESYLDHHADKLWRRFDANSYLVLTEAMNAHDVGRGRGGVERALAQVRAALTVVALDSDRLYPPEHSLRVADLVLGARFELVASRHGHDGFLVEHEAVERILRQVLGEASPGSDRIR